MLSEEKIKKLATETKDTYYVKGKQLREQINSMNFDSIEEVVSEVKCLAIGLFLLHTVLETPDIEFMDLINGIEERKEGTAEKENALPAGS